MQTHGHLTLTHLLEFEEFLAFWSQMWPTTHPPAIQMPQTHDPTAGEKLRCGFFLNKFYPQRLKKGIFGALQPIKLCKRNVSYLQDLACLLRKDQNIWLNVSVWCIRHFCATEFSKGQVCKTRHHKTATWDSCYLYSNWNFGPQNIFCKILHWHKTKLYVDSCPLFLWLSPHPFQCDYAFS